MRVSALLTRPVPPSPTAGRGISLLEVLIVMTIMLMVTAASIPIVRPALENRQLREGSRLVSSFIQGARSRAIEIGRPVGVMMARENGRPYATTLAYIEMPQPYAGDFLDSKMTFTTSFPGGNIDVTAVFTHPGEVGWSGLLKYGDFIRIGLSGPLYMLSSTNSATPPNLFIDPSAGQAIADPSSTLLHILTTSGYAPTSIPYPDLGNKYTASFQVFRQPVRSSVAPLQLPEGVVVDLYYSGTTSAGMFGFLGFDYYFTFAPSGYVDFIAPNRSRPAGPLFFLVGKRELMPDVSISRQDENFSDPATVPKNLYLNNFWVKVDYQTGHVSVAETARFTGTVGSVRQFAISGQSTGGR